ncbi:sulfite exporter TauE/SafE family protein [Thermoactinomyces intermedius]|jgi:cytochrome c-type biogenesis protein|uniref:Sulfite exporter TauE/SafE family protein n=2 Tax=Thermoactinomyces intermedius TaxID=2024 RepID=A0A8I1A7L9_THEIN|nr:cytochrome c biogenesis protein CcdA [Thermoactinomyces intermedius]MBA4547585.1 sulfite exporter TauE/SafE family protein [Thermoactinomyces intermedius]MBA4836225.1 sulfite exporter TauE/SafE family protein [Thermoactinomyces intermedius]MBH8594186.1 sulfite exporter TauE/SafE family protein [Thermoactinomyces intermedius]
MVEQVSWWLAFGAGVLSFVSPCSLPLYPSYLSYITGISVNQLKEKRRMQEVMLHTVFFLIGFSMIFYAIGFSASWFGAYFKEYQDLMRMLGAVLIVAMGLFMLGIFRPAFLMREYKWQVSKKNVSYLGSLAVGIGFSAGWTPCIGPIFAAIITFTTLNPEMRFVYVTAYILGFSIPFLLMAFFMGKTRWILRYSEKLMKAGGALMILLGVLLYTDQMTVFTAWLAKVTGFQGF